MRNDPPITTVPSADLIRAITDLLPAYIAYVDRDLRYVAANQMYIERFGRAEEQIVGRLVAEVTGPAFASVAPHLLAALDGEVQHLEPRMISVDGYRNLVVTHLPHRDKDGNVLGVIVYGRDVTEQRRAEAALLQSEKIAAVGRLASSIAHEINNPLESVVNLLYLVEHSIDEDPAQARKYAQMAQRELTRVSQITTQTLRFFRQSTARRAADLPDLLDSVLALYVGKLINAEIEVRREYRRLDPILCFEGELRQALNNIVGNAIDAMRDGGGTLRIRARAATDFATGRQGARITIADTGTGMSAATRARIFEPFFTTKGILGTGLGLWITAELIDKEQGRIRVRSRERAGGAGLRAAAGTVFAVFLVDEEPPNDGPSQAADTLV